MLQEALRLAHLKIVTDRDAPIPSERVRKPKNEPQVPLDGKEKAVRKSHDAAIKRWATTQGIPFQRISKKLRDLYDEAHHES